MSDQELSPLRYSIDEVAVIQVIRIQFCQGAGVPGDMCRTVTDYHDMDGRFLARDDPCVKAVYEEPPPETLAQTFPIDRAGKA